MIFPNPIIPHHPIPLNFPVHYQLSVLLPLVVKPKQATEDYFIQVQSTIKVHGLASRSN